VSLLCVGEVLVDLIGGDGIPGGAPANVACHVASLGERSLLLSRVGNDENGRYLLEWLDARGVRTDLVQTDPACPTGVVRVLPGPRYEIGEPAAWDFIADSDAAAVAAAAPGAVVFGTLAQRQPVSRKTIRALVATVRAAGVPVLCDLNLRAPFFDEETVLWSLRHCDLLKLNREELETVSFMLSARGETGDLFRGLLREFGIGRGVLTAGEKGAWLCEDGELFHQPAAEAPRVVDAVGAGDAFTAVVSVALQRGVSLRRAGPAAAELSAHVLSRTGGTPVVPDELAARINSMLAA